MKCFIILIAWLSVIYLNSCKQKEPVPRIPISDVRLKDALLIKKGSYFVYVDSNTYIRDSFYFLNDAVANYKYNEVKNIYYEGIVDCVGYNSNVFLSTISLYCGYGIQDAISWHYGDGNNDEVAKGTLVKLPFVEGAIETVNGQSFTAIRHYDSFKNNGQTYLDVYELEILAGGRTNHTFFSMQAGAVIRFTTDISGILRAYNLVNYKTVR